MEVDAVLFDYSGVMTSNFAVPADESLFDRDAMYAEMAGAMMNEVDHPWHALERGDITLEAFIAEVESRVPGCGALFRVDSPLNVMANLDLLPERVELVRRVRATGRRVGLLTNNVAEWEPLWRAGLPDDLFEVVIDSSAVGCRKPEPEIYRLALDTLDAVAERTLFIDDFEWNLEGAAGLGMRVVHCSGDVDLDEAVEQALS